MDPWKFIGQPAKPTRRSSGSRRDPDSNKRWNAGNEWHLNCFLTSTCKYVHTDGEVEKEMREGKERKKARGQTEDREGITGGGKKTGVKGEEGEGRGGREGEGERGRKPLCSALSY